MPYQIYQPASAYIRINRSPGFRGHQKYEKNITWKYFADTKEITTILKKEGFEIIAVEQDKKSVDFKKIKPKYPVAVVMGNEVGGIDKKTLTLCDVVVEIPMKGKKESLNVSVSFGIAGYQLFS